MRAARQIVSRLLEDEGEEFDAYADLASISDATGITKNDALTANIFRSKKLKYTKSSRPIEVWRNGKTKTWKREPTKFQIPVKYGLKDCFYIDNFYQNNADDWIPVR